ncbi:hypothetical protein CH330_00505 [candidate division WOR-3 bacterium JGI_Cruoil_03_51_56]|uniref:Uncharacterized protein n=1 Tax=candidate division WOR-3 bacterium JGI_Cruoil_03_51_56 TaxID=1973747 RepID=A0A235BZT8_UNCW3|nr:MAG: hypothetical protein CH330_00505 [candidate division WOR-3 bacterium JGI_Cruoil_03_51_56]
MNLRIPKSGPLLRAAGLGLCLFVAVLFFGCGRTPPEEIWEPDSEDSTAVDGIIQANMDLFLSAFNEANLDTIDKALPGTTATRLAKEMAENPFKQRFRCDAIQHEFFSDSFDLEYSFIANLDTAKAETTNTVTIVETIPGKFHMHAYSYTRYLRDTVFETGETLHLYDSGFSDTSMIVVKELSGTSTNGCVLKKEDGNWQLWKLAGGSRFYSPNPEDAPYLAYLYLTNGSEEYKITLRPDTSQYGIQRFYDLEDELPTFKVGDTIYVRGLATTVLDAANYFYFDGVRHEFKSSDKIPLTQAGIHRLYAEQIPIEVLYEIGGDYSSVVWGIAVKVIE